MTTMPQIAEQRVSTLVGDRLCISCGYNLTGQAVLREPHYQMLIVRCPECGTVASVQEYPLLGRWANRWAAALAGLWLIFIIALLFGTAATIFGFSVGTAETACWTFQSQLSQRFATYQSSTPNITHSSQDYINWSDQQNFRAIFEELGGWRGAVDWTALLVWIPYSIVVFMLGCLWATALLGMSWKKRMASWALVMLIAGVFCGITILDWSDNTYQWWGAHARRIIGIPLLWISLGFGAIVLVAGIMAGRKITRLAISILLPPRFQHALAMFWITDGLPAPKPQK